MAGVRWTKDDIRALEARRARVRSGVKAAYGIDILET